MKSLALAFVRLRSKSPRQLIRSILIRLWPLSLLVRSYYSARRSRWYRDRANCKAREAFLANPRLLNDVQRQCFEELREHGATSISAEKLFNDADLLARLQREANRLLSAPDVRKQIDNRRAPNQPKWYVIRALGYRMEISLSDPLVELFTHPELLAVITHYFGMRTRLAYADIWYNLPARDGEPSIDSERWHRDHEDTQIVKVYFYLDAVDNAGGPLQYVRGSHATGKYAKLYPAKPPFGSYPPAGAVEKNIDANACQVFTGPAGTLVLCDTAGLHRGGRTTIKPRILITGMYVSNIGLEKRTISLDNPQRWENAELESRYLLGRE
jgi:hypothetical protein